MLSVILIILNDLLRQIPIKAYDLGGYEFDAQFIINAAHKQYDTIIGNNKKKKLSRTERTTKKG